MKLPFLLLKIGTELCEDQALHSTAAGRLDREQEDAFLWLAHGSVVTAASSNRSVKDLLPAAPAGQRRDRR
jgi:hypothetical protein